MTGGVGDTVTLELRDLGELFEPPAFTVDDPPTRLGSGMDEVMAVIEDALPHAPARLALVVRSATGPGTEAEVAAAIGRWCHLNLERTEREARAARRNGLRALPVGLAVLAIGLGLAQLFRASGLSGGVRDYFSNGLFLVASWVALWHPIEAFLYGWRPAARERRILQVVLALDVRVHGAETTTA